MDSDTEIGGVTINLTDTLKKRRDNSRPCGQLNISDTRNSTPVQSGRLSKRYINTSLTPCQHADKSGNDGGKNGGPEDVSDVVRSSERDRTSTRLNSSHRR